MKQPLLRALATALIVLVGAACGTATPSASPTSPPVTPPPTPSATPSPPLTAAPLAWRRIEDGPVSGFVDSSLFWTGSRFLAAGSDADGHARLFDSVDGRVWSAQPPIEDGGKPLGGYAFAAMAAGAGAVVIVGSSDQDPSRPMSWYSPDGRSWTASPPQPAFATGPGYWVKMNGVSASADGFIAVGEENPVCMCANSWTSAVVWHSADGLHWTRAAASAALSKASMRQVVQTPSGFVAVGEAIEQAPTPGSDILNPYAVAWTSPDGIRWTRSPDSPALHPAGGAEPAALAVLGRRLVVLGEAGGGVDPVKAYVLWSDDGVDWAPPASPASPDGPSGLYGGGGLAATATGFLGLRPLDRSASACPAGIWMSGDGQDWTCAPALGLPAGADPITLASGAGTTVLLLSESAAPFLRSLWIGPVHPTSEGAP